MNYRNATIRPLGLDRENREWCFAITFHTGTETYVYGHTARQAIWDAKELVRRYNHERADMHRRQLILLAEREAREGALPRTLREYREKIMEERKR